MLAEVSSIDLMKAMNLSQKEEVKLYVKAALHAYDEACREQTDPSYVNEKGVLAIDIYVMRCRDLAKYIDENVSAFEAYYQDQSGEVCVLTASEIFDKYKFRAAEWFFDKHQLRSLVMH